ncbi:hypothetical protein BGZ93_008790 [Podila epicladia]|nr:hypothetical protein BGZ92_010950 [Podila epicladia]KAG0091557.1 hypothetical protein BGZ93_008790 [Podila epicladia]
MTVTSYTSDDSHSKSKGPEDGQVMIHSKQTRTKTQAEIEKEKWMEVHRLAVEGNRKMYIDPKTGYSVMTELLHKRRGYCCGNACRHCPYDNENVGVSQEVKKTNIELGKQRRKEIEAVEGKPVWADDPEDSESE